MVGEQEDDDFKIPELPTWQTAVEQLKAGGNGESSSLRCWYNLLRAARWSTISEFNCYKS